VRREWHVSRLDVLWRRPVDIGHDRHDPAQPQIDHAVVRWKKRWQLKIDRPMLHSIAVMQSNALRAVNGDAAASYRLTRAFNVLSNCRNPLEFPPLGDTPAPPGTSAIVDTESVQDVLRGDEPGHQRTQLAEQHYRRPRPGHHQRGEEEAPRRFGVRQGGADDDVIDSRLCAHHFAPA
jgi:hypothetical protein